MIPAERGEAPARPVKSEGFSRQQDTEARLSDHELTEWRTELLDPEGWREVLEKYAHTMNLAVALTDAKGNVLGACHNAQPVWRMVREAVAESGPACTFCLAPWPPCTAVADSLKTGTVLLVHDQARLAHLTVPLLLGGQRLGTLIAGQVFDRYPEPLPLQRIARDFGVSTQRLWREAVHQMPISKSALLIYGDLLASLGQAFLRQRYAAILHRKLAETNRRYRLMIEGAKDHALFTIDGWGKVTSWNPGAERLLGYKDCEILGQDFRCLFGDEEVRSGVPDRAIRNAGRVGWIEEEYVQVRKDGTRFFSETVMASIGEGDTHEFGRLVRDVTERRRSAEVVLQAQKLESIGVLAGGIAHDFNNLLTGILGNVSLAAAGLPSGHPSHALLINAEKACQTAASLIVQLLAYAGKGNSVITRFDLSAVVSGLMPLLTISIERIVELDLSLPAGLPWIEADKGEVQQIIMNLVINAAEAMGPQGGKVRVSTGLTHIEQSIGAKVQSAVYFEVQDSGCGMDAATEARIFDPFFTTKFSGRGLGLAAVSGIVRRVNGQMQVVSTPGEGSTFRISFPAFKAQAVVTPRLPLADSPQGSGLILVVEDDASIRTLAQRILERCGFTVLVAENGAIGVSLFRENAACIVAVLLDLAMPVMGGLEAFNLMKETRPGVPIVISTGYREVAVRDQFKEPIADVLGKPYTPAELAGRIATVIQHSWD